MQKKIYVLFFALFALSFGRISAQNVLWWHNTPMAETLFLYDTAYVDIDFTLDATTNETVSLTLTSNTPGLVVVSDVPQAVVGNNTVPIAQTPLVDGVPFALASMTGRPTLSEAGDRVSLRVKITTADCALSTASLTVSAQTPTGSLFNGTKSFSVPLSKPSFSPLLTNGGTIVADPLTLDGTMDVQLQVSGVLNDAVLTLSGYEISCALDTVWVGTTRATAVQLPVANITSSTSTVNGIVNRTWTIKLPKAFLETTDLPDSKLTNDAHVYFKLRSKTECGSKVYNLNGWYPVTAANKDAACGTMSDASDWALMLQMDGPVAPPYMTRYGLTGNVQRIPFGHPLMDPLTGTSITLNSSYNAYQSYSDYDYSLPITRWIREALQNDGGSPAEKVVLRFGTTVSNDNVSAYIDTSQIYYFIGTLSGNVPTWRIARKKLDPTAKDVGMALNYLGKTATRAVLPAYGEMPRQIQCTIPDRINAGEILLLYWGEKMVPMYDADNQYITDKPGVTDNIYYPDDLRHILYTPRFSQDTCGNPSEGEDSYTNSFFYFPRIWNKKPNFSLRETTPKEVRVDDLYLGSVLNDNGAGITTSNPSVDLFVKLPAWMQLDTLNYGDSALMLTSQNYATEYPAYKTNHGNGGIGRIYYHGNHTYSIRLLPTTDWSDRSLSLVAHYLYDPTATGHPFPVNQTDTVKYWLNYNTWKDDGSAGFYDGATPQRITFEKIGYTNQMATLVVEKDGFVLENFTLRRVSRGYLDTNNNNVPDNHTLVPDSLMAHNEYFPQDTGYFYWKGYVAPSSDQNTTAWSYLSLLMSNPVGSNNTIANLQSGNVWSSGNPFLNSGRLKPMPEGAEVKVTSPGTPPVLYDMSSGTITVRKPTRTDVTKLELLFAQNLNAGDTVEVKLPFYVFQTYDQSASLSSFHQGEGFVSNSVYANGFLPSDRHGKDTIASDLVRLNEVGYNDYNDFGTLIYHVASGSNTGNVPGVTHGTMYTRTVTSNAEQTGFYSGSLPAIFSDESYIRFKNEVRLPYRIDSITISLPEEGWRFYRDSLSFQFARYFPGNNGYNTITNNFYGEPVSTASYNHWLKADAFNRTFLKADLGKMIDHGFTEEQGTPAAASITRTSSTSLTATPTTITHKNSPFMESSRIYPFPRYRATRAATGENQYAVVSWFYHGPDGIAYKNVVAEPLVYTGLRTTLQLAETHLDVRNYKGVVMREMSFGNPNGITLFNNYLYLEGNIKDAEVKILDDARNPAALRGQVHTGIGEGNRWVKIADSLQAYGQVYFSVTLKYTGEDGKCQDTVRFHAVSGYQEASTSGTGSFGYWDPAKDHLVFDSHLSAIQPSTPAVESAWDDNDIIHGGPVREMTLSVDPAAVAGSLTARNTDPSVLANVINYGKEVELTAMLTSAWPGYVGAVRAEMDIKVPEGLKYRPGSAQVIYPDNTTAVPVAAAYEAYLAATLLDSTSERTILYHPGAATGDSTLMLDGDSYDSLKRASLLLYFSPTCDVPISGFRFEGEIRGENACGMAAANSGRAVYTPFQYPRGVGSYDYNVLAYFENDQSIVAPADTTIRILYKLTKARGTDPVSTADSLLLSLHSAFTPMEISLFSNVTGHTAAVDLLGSARQDIYGSNRTLRTLFPAAGILNGTVGNGYNTTDTLFLEVLAGYNREAFKTSSDQAAAQLVRMNIFSQQLFDTEHCGNLTVSARIGAVDTAVIVVDLNPYPAIFCEGMSTSLNIDNYDDYNYLYTWYYGGNVQGAGPTPPNFIVKPQFSDTLFIKVLENKEPYRSLGMVTYPYYTHPFITTEFGPDTVCLQGYAFTDASYTTSNPLTGATATIADWQWTIDDTVLYTAQHPYHLFTTSGDHKVHLQVTSSDGCVDTMTKSIFVRGLYTIVCPVNVLDTLPYGECLLTPPLGQPSINSTPALMDTHVSVWNDSPGTFPAGVHTVTWQVRDNYCPHIAADSCQQLVVVNHPPCGINDTVWDINGIPSIATSMFTATDADGNVYNTVRMGCDCWTKENMVADNYTSSGAISPAPTTYVSERYPNAAANKATFGYLYDYAAVTKGGTSTQGICPDGWRVPAETNYRRLVDNYTSGELKKAGGDYWLGEAPSNSTGFDAVPAGYRDGATGGFYKLLGDTWFWIYSPGASSLGRACHILFNCPDILIEDFATANGASVRCVKVN